MNNRPELAESSRQSDDSEGDIFICFTPAQDCVSEIVKCIENAEKSIILQAYSFSSEPIAKALINAFKKKISIEVFIDKDADTKTGNLIQELRKEGIKIEIDQLEGRAHNKVMIIDNEYVITGSYNWTDDRYDHNSDVIIFIRDACVNKLYKDNYKFNIEANKRKRLEEVGLFDELGFPNSECCLFSIYNMSLNDGFTTVNSENKKKKERSKNFAEVEVCFPRYSTRNCIELICDHIKHAEKSILIQVPSLTHIDISYALEIAHRKGVPIKLLIDRKAINDIGQRIGTLISLGIEVRYDKTSYPGIAHSKIIIIDDDLALTGSLNLTFSAQNRNRENLLCIRNIQANKTFKENFCFRWDKAIQFSSMELIFPRFVFGFFNLFFGS